MSTALHASSSVQAAQQRDIRPRVSMRDSLANCGTLLDAWWHVKRGGGSPGPDRISTDRFENRLDAHIDSLLTRLAAGTYRAGPVARVFLPKPNGGSRAIGIANLEDRVLQTAAGQWLQQLLEPQFLDCSFGYRPGKGPQRSAVFAARIAARHTWAINADIEKFFDNVDHAILSRLLAEAGVESEDRALLLAWLRAPPLDRGAPLVTVKGVPQGLPVSPPLANLYLHGFDLMLANTGRPHVRYADDFIVFAHSEGEAAESLQAIAKFLRQERKLFLKASRTSVIPVEQGFEFVGFAVNGQGLSLSASAAERFKETYADRLRDLATDFSLATRRLNDVVRGWRAYYGGLSQAIDAQLADLDLWRREQATRALSGIGHPPSMVDGVFDSLSTAGTPVVVAGYGGEGPAGRDVPDATPVVAVPPLPKRRSSEVRTQAIGLEQQPWLSDRGDLIVPTNGAFVTRAGKTLIVKWKRHTVFEIPIGMVKHVSIVGQGVVLATTVIAACVAAGIRIWMMDRFGRAVGHFVSTRRPVDPKVARAQMRVALGRRGTRLVSDLLIGKVRNQRALLLYHAKGASRPADVRAGLREAAASLRAALTDLRAEHRPLPAARQSLLLVEARAAAVYWSVFARLVPASMSFPGRRGRGATDQVNSMLNYGYYKLLQWIWAAIDRVALVPWLGLLHTGRRRSPGLVLDLMEEFRAVAVDRVVLGLLGRGFVPRQAPDGRLRQSSRSTLERALAANIERPIERGGPALAKVIRDQAGAFRRALEGGHEYRARILAW